MHTRDGLTIKQNKHVLRASREGGGGGGGHYRNGAAEPVSTKRGPTFNLKITYIYIMQKKIVNKNFNN